MKRIAVAIALATFALGAAAQQPPAGQNPRDAVPDKMPFDVPYGAPVSLDRAQAAINAAVAESKKRGWKMNVAVVDSGANLVAFARMDGAQLGSIAIAEHKARAAAKFRRETKLFESGIQEGNLHYLLTLDDVIASRGGILIIDNGQIAGAVGCSGGTGSQDEVVCKAAVDAVSKR